MASAVDRIWPQDSSQTPSLTASDTTARGHARSTAWSRSSRHRNDTQRRLQSQALQLSSGPLARHAGCSPRSRKAGPCHCHSWSSSYSGLRFCSRVSGSLRRHSTPRSSAFFSVCALVGFAAIFLVLELDRPFEGTLQLSVARCATLARMGQQRQEQVPGEGPLKSALGARMKCR